MDLENTPQGEVASSQSEPIVSDGSSATETIDDLWQSAKEVFDPSEAETQPTTIEETTGDTESHVEQSEPKTVEQLMDLSDLVCANKYKPAVQERINQIVESHQKEAQAISENLEQHQETLSGLVRVFNEIAKNPQKIVEYAAEYGEHIGLEPEVIEHYRNFKSGGASQPQQNQPNVNQGQGEAIKAMAIDAIVDKYAESMITTQDPRQFVSILKQQNTEIAQAVQQEMLGKVGQLLKLYHDQMIAPDKETLKEFKTRAEQDAQQARFEATRGAWNDALSKVKAKFQDLDKYEPKIRQRLREDPNFSELRKSLNKDPQNIERRIALIEQIYKLESMDDRFSRVTSPKPKANGLMPNSKHISTQKSGPVSWDDSWKSIKEEIFS